jgi:hypothetical protein
MFLQGSDIFLEQEQRFLGTPEDNFLTIAEIFLEQDKRYSSNKSRDFPKT